MNARRSGFWVGPAVVIACIATCTAPRAPVASPVSDGAALYMRHCAVCHGADGDADTTVANLLLPRPNPFRQGLFKLVSTTNGMPTEADLVATLRRGMPGSTMMSWEWLGEADLTALARFVRELAVRGRAENIHQTAAVTGRAIELEQATEIAERELLPGPTVALGEPAEPTAATLAEGERQFVRHCAACHGPDGRGLPHAAELPTDGTWLWPRDFTAGYLRGEASHRALASRILAGMPGAHMPGLRLATAETEALVAYVKSLVPADAEQRHVQWRRSLRVEPRRALPADARDWETIDAVRLPLVPVRWRPGQIEEVWLRVAHDGEQLAVQLRWRDASHDERAVPGRVLGDGVAMQFTAEPDPPLLAMGSPMAPVNVWRWHAFDPREVAGLADLVGAPMHAGLDVPTNVRTAPRIESATFHGVDSVGESAGAGMPLAGGAHWQDGQWTVTFRRPLAARSPREVDLAAAELRLFAVAIWNGAEDRDVASKCISTWHSLQIVR